MTGYRKQILPQKTTGVFVGGLLGFIVLVVLVVAVIVTGLFSYNFLAYMNLRNIFMQFLLFGALACGIAMTSRAKGPDLSIGALVALTGVMIAATSGSWIIGLVLAFLVCTSIGAVNGILIVFLRIPSLIMTIVVTVIVRSVVYIISNGMVLRIDRFVRAFVDLQVGGIRIIPLAIFAGAFVVAFFVILFSRLGKPLSKREATDNRSASYFVAYLLSSIIAFFVGTFLVSRLGSASPNVGNNYEIFIILCFAVITSSRFMDNRGVPVVIAIVTAILYVLLTNVLVLYGLNPHWNQLVVGLIALAFLVISYIARKDSLKGLVHRV
jgi:ribose/xylose/arabinose/galactoside ABC-type transport system permease subunit